MFNIGLIPAHNFGLTEGRKTKYLHMTLTLGKTRFLNLHMTLTLGKTRNPNFDDNNQELKEKCASI